MKKIKEFTKKNIKLIIGLLIGTFVSGIGVYASTILYTGNEISFDNSKANLTLNDKSVTNMQEAMDALYEKAEGPCKLKLGDYFTLTPTATSFTIKTAITGYTSDQTINPSELNLWRVIDIHKDGSFDAVSEYVSSTGVYFRGTTGYANFVGGLQTIAASYAKPGYTISTRMMGYGGQTPTIADTIDFDGTYNPNDNPDVSPPSSTSTPSPTTGTGEEYSGGVLGDTLYLKDYLLVSNVYKSDTSTYGSTGLKAYNVSSTSSAKAYWIASRRFYWLSASSFYFNGRYVDTSGNLGSRYIRFVSNLRWRDDGNGSDSLRPILTLRSGLTVSSGSGAKESPYVLS